MNDMLRTPGRVGTALLVLVLGASLLAGCGGTTKKPRGAEYVALGDSISAGAGIPPIGNTLCSRSKVNYPSLVAKAMHYSSFKDVTCGGARTNDITESRNLRGQVLAPQLDAVGTATRVVTLTIGLNDKGFSTALFFTCISTDGMPSSLCQQVLAVPPATTSEAIDQSGGRVEEVLRAIKAKAPKAKIILVGYPRIAPDSGSCPDRVPWVAQILPRMRSAVEEINVRWREAAKQVGAEYVDTYALSKDHDVCAADPWTNGVVRADKAAVLHPFEAFHQAVADQVVALLEH